MLKISDLSPDSFFFAIGHSRLTGNINFQDNLLNVLLTRNLPWEMEAPSH